MARPAAVPVVALTGYLGAGKTSLLNHVLRQRGARVGVVVNDFGDIDVDAALLTGQVEEPAAISGGCLCCLNDTDELDTALERLSDPRLRLDAIVVEASGLADPATLARLIRFSGAPRVRPGGVVDVVDAVHHRRTVDRDESPPARYGVASLVVVNKLDQLPTTDRDAAVADVAGRVRARNPRAQVIGSVGGRIDPALLYDVASTREDPGQLPLRDLLLDEGTAHPHVDAEAVSVSVPAGADPGRVVDLLEHPPDGVYRLKGTVTVWPMRAWRSYSVNLVGSHVHVATAPRAAEESRLVAIGPSLDRDRVTQALGAALAPAAAPPRATGFRRLQRWRRLSL